MNGRQASNLVFAAGQAAVPFLGYAGLYGKTTGAEFQVTRTPVVPADYAFAIWGLIFMLCLIYAVDQARPGKANDPIYRRIGWLTAAAFGANMIWALIAQQELPLVLTGLVFLITLVTILPAADRLFRSDGEGGTSYLPARLAVGTLAAWVSVAIYANWSVVLEDLGLADVPTREMQALVFLSAAGATATAMVVRAGAPLPYVATIGWALAGIVVANVQRNTTSVAVGASLWLCAIGAATWLVRRRRARSHSAPAAAG